MIQGSPIDRELATLATMHVCCKAARAAATASISAGIATAIAAAYSGMEACTIASAVSALAAGSSVALAVTASIRADLAGEATMLAVRKVTLLRGRPHLVLGLVGLFFAAVALAGCCDRPPDPTEVQTARTHE